MLLHSGSTLAYHIITTMASAQRRHQKVERTSAYQEADGYRLKREKTFVGRAVFPQGVTLEQNHETQVGYSVCIYWPTLRPIPHLQCTASSSSELIARSRQHTRARARAHTHTFSSIV